MKTGTRSYCVLRQTSLLVDMMIWLDTPPDLPWADAFKIPFASIAKVSPFSSASLIELELPKQTVFLGHRTLPLGDFERNSRWPLKIVPTEETTSRWTPQLKTLFSGTGIGRKFSPIKYVSWSLHLLLPSSPALWLPIDCLLPALSSAAQFSIHPDTFLVPQCCRWSIQSSPFA